MNYGKKWEKAEWTAAVNFEQSNSQHGTSTA
jgi:hypothetical protein